MQPKMTCFFLCLKRSLAFEEGIVRSDKVFHLVAVVTASMLLNSSTDVMVDRQFKEADLEQ